MLRHKSVIHVEVSQQKKSTLEKDILKAAVLQFMKESPPLKTIPTTLSDSSDLGLLRDHVSKLAVTSNAPFNGVSKDTPFEIHVYKLNPSVSAVDGAIELSEDVNAATCRILPTLEFDGLWESLLYDSNIKEEALRYVETAMIASDYNIDPMLIGLNRLMLLYGPPGTGKTSLCKALAQKTAIRMSDRFVEFQFVEINSHSLFSKWFSESGKLVQKMFDQIHEILEDEQLFLFVLIDEVESLTMSRKETKNEPSDGLRVVNALLTQIDQLKTHRNVLVLATSNLRNSIDEAFLDRADVSYEVSLPTKETAYDVLFSCIAEFKQKGLISKANDDIFGYKFINGNANGSQESSSLMNDSYLLWDIVKSMKPCSARFLRKVAFQALMKVSELPTKLTDYLGALQESVDAKN